MQFIKQNVDIKPDSLCWEWKRSLTSAGYGQFTKHKKYWTTHRYVYTQTFGEIPKDKVVRHLCHNTKCCNPEHLKLGTLKDNWKDSEDKYRVAHSKRSKGYFIKDKYFESLRTASKETGLATATILKYTDKVSRQFDEASYRNGAYIARKELSSIFK